MRKQFLAKDLSLINQKKKEKKNPRQSRKKTRSFQDSVPGNYPGQHYHDGHVSLMHDSFAQTHRNKCPGKDSVQWVGGMKDWTAPAQRMMDEDPGGCAYVREGQVGTIHTLCSVLLHL